MSIEDFRHEMIKHGLNPPIDIRPGVWERFPGIEQKNGSKDACCMLFPDMQAGVFKDFRYHDDYLNWFADGEKSEMTQEQIDFFIKKNIEAEEKRERQWAEKAAEAKAFCGCLDQADINHPYLVDKQVKPFGILQAGEKLVIPLSDGSGGIMTYQTIDQDGNKKLMFGGKKQGCAFPMTGTNDIIFICEGFSTGASIHEATGKTVLVAIDAGNLRPVVESVIEKKMPGKIIVAADNDWHHEDGVGVGIRKARKICDIFKGQVDWIAPPKIDPEPGEKPSGTDWNDYIRKEGLTAGRRLLTGEDDRLFDMADANVSKNLTCLPSPREYLVYCFGRGFLPKNIVAEICATGGTGKSIFALQFAHMMAGGEKGFYPFSVAGEPKKVLYLSLEDDQDELDRRLWAITELGENKPENLFALSLVGKEMTLMESDQSGNPVRTQTFSALDRSLEGQGIECLILDPYSRAFTGLKENDNGHGTAVIKACEYLSQKHNLAVILIHHANKQSQNSNYEINQSMGRGASSVVDGCRFMFGMCGLSEQDLTRFNIEKESRYKYVKAGLPKANYSGKFSDMFFELVHVPETDTVVMRYMESSGGLMDQIINLICCHLHSFNAETRRKLKRTKDGPGADIKKQLGDEVTSAAINEAINIGIQDGTFAEKSMPKIGGKGGFTKKIIMTKKGAEKVVFHPSIFEAEIKTEKTVLD